MPTTKKVEIKQEAEPVVKSATPNKLPDMLTIMRVFEREGDDKSFWSIRFKERVKCSLSPTILQLLLSEVTGKKSIVDMVGDSRLLIGMQIPSKALTWREAGEEFAEGKFFRYSSYRLEDLSELFEGTEGDLNYDLQVKYRNSENLYLKNIAQARLLEVVAD